MVVGFRGLLRSAWKHPGRLSGHDGPVMQRETTWVAPDADAPSGEPGGRPGRDQGAIAPGVSDPGAVGLTDPTASGAHFAAAGVAVARGDDPWPDTSGSDSAAAGFEMLEPVGATGVLDGGFELLRGNFRLLFGLTAAMFLPLQILDLFVMIGSGTTPEVDGPVLFAAFGTLGTTSAISWLVLALRVMALSLLGLTAGLIVGDRLESRSRSHGQVLRAAGRRWWVAALIPLMVVPVKVAAGCLLYVGFFFADALLMCASVVAGAEGAGPFRSVGRSWRLGWRSLGTAAGVAFGAFVISGILQLSIFVGPTLLAASFVTNESVLLVIQQISLLALLVTQPLTACIAAKAYVELRCRTEGLDLALRRRQLGLVA